MRCDEQTRRSCHPCEDEAIASQGLQRHPVARPAEVRLGLSIATAAASKCRGPANIRGRGADDSGPLRKNFCDLESCGSSNVAVETSHTVAGCKTGLRLNCRDAIEQFGDFVDGDLRLIPRMRLRIHTWLCQHCRNYLRSYRITLLAEKSARFTPNHPDADALVAQIVGVRLAEDSSDPRDGRPNPPRQ